MTCEVEGCQKDCFLIFYKKEVCEMHWKQECNGKINLKTIKWKPIIELVEDD